VRVLIDGHAFVWALLQDPRVSKKARSILFSEEHELFFSLATLWELSLKIRLGKLRNLTSSIAYLNDELAEYRITVLPITYQDILTVEHLEYHHRDPFDRVLIAQAINNSLTLLTNDANIKLYSNVTTLW
jgi:PIN domain nuclease of toxin-antitoxin system